MKFSRIVIILFCIFAINNAFSQSLPGIRVGFGMSTMAIAGDNPNTWPFASKLDPKGFAGANFSGPQLGASLKFYFPLDKSNQLFQKKDNMPIELKREFTLEEREEYLSYGDERVVLGLNNYWFEGQQVIPEGFNRHYFKHSQNVFNVELGYEECIYKIPKARSQVYAGASLMLTNVGESKIDYKITEIDNLNNEIPLDSESDKMNIEMENNRKNSTWRVGGNIKLGIEGALYDRFTLNASWGLGFLNINRDNNRGELFTHSKSMILTEYKETKVFTFLFSLLIKYRI